MPDLTGAVVATDNCGVPFITQEPEQGITISATTVVTLTATDGAGLTDTCQVTVTVADNTPPEITACAPQPAPLALDENCRAPLPDLKGAVQAADNCGDPVITQNPAPGTLISEDTVVTLTATDEAGLTDTCQVTVTVEPCEPSADLRINNLSQDATVYASSSAGPIPLIVTMSAPAGTQSITLSDSQTQADITVTDPPYATVVWIDPAQAEGERTIEVTATLADSSQISASMTFTVAQPPLNSDSDANGIPDNPFGFLQPGDLWLNLRYDQPSDGVGTTTVKCIGYDANTAALQLDASASESAETAVSVLLPADLLESGEIGMVVIAAAADLDTLLGETLAAQMPPAPDGLELVAGGTYAEITLLKGQQGGDTYSEIDAAVLESKPIEAGITLTTSPSAGAELFSCHSEIASDTATGLFVSPTGTVWNPASTGKAIEGASLTRLMRSPAIVAAFDAVPSEGEGEGSPNEGEGEGQTEDDTPGGCFAGSVDEHSGPGSALPMLALAALMLIMFNKRLVNRLTHVG